MSWIETLLTELEARLRLIIEGDARGDGFPRRLHRRLERELILAMRMNAVEVPCQPASADVSLVAPDQYTLLLPSVEAQVLLNHPTELDHLAGSLENAAARAGFLLVSAPILRVVADPQSVTLRIQTEHSQPGVSDSSTFQLEGEINGSSQPQAEQLPESFLIVNGLATFQITAPVINIGRDPSNQLQLDDPHISRHHAQLRYIQGRFVIFDLDSQGGTYVNGVLVSSRALNPGDVIQLANLPLVYGLESTVPGGQTQKLAAAPPPPEVL